VSSDPVRWSGLAAVVGGVAWILAWTILGAMPVAPPGGHREGWESFNLWSGVALMLTMIGLTGAHLRQVRRIGGIGHAGFVLPWIGTASMGAGRLGQLVEIGGTWILVILGAFALTSGVVLFGIATLRAKVFPSAAGLLLSAAGLMLFLVDPENRRAFLALLYGIAWLWLGYAL
jgi:hypothetical protein